jgi:N-acetylneuraminic acid mutarotase
LGGGAGHQNSLGRFNSTYTLIEDKLWTSYATSIYFVEKNRWYYMRTPGLRLPQGTRLLRPEYDPVHDVVIVHEASGTWIYSVHNNEWIKCPYTPGPGRRVKYGAAVDEKRGLYYLIGGASGSYCDTHVDDMWAFDPVTRAWQQVNFHCLCNAQ